MTGNIAPLAKDWLEAKQEEEYAKARRIEIEKQLTQALDVPDEGSKTHKIDGYKITVTQPVSRKIDLDAWDKVSDHLPIGMQPIKTKVEADPAGCKYLAKEEPEMWAKVASAFTVQPGKVGFKVEEA